MTICQVPRRISVGIVAGCLCALAGMVQAQAAKEAPDDLWPEVATFSIVGFDPETRSFDVPGRPEDYEFTLTPSP